MLCMVSERWSWDRIQGSHFHFCLAHEEAFFHGLFFPFQEEEGKTFHPLKALTNPVITINFCIPPCWDWDWRKPWSICSGTNFHSAIMKVFKRQRLETLAFKLHFKSDHRIIQSFKIQPHQTFFLLPVGSNLLYIFASGGRCRLNTASRPFPFPHSPPQPL